MPIAPMRIVSGSQRETNLRAEQRTHAQRKTQEGLILLVIAAVSGIGAALTGAILALIASGFLEPWIGFRITWWQGLLVGGLIGAGGGLFQAISINRRSRALDQSAMSLGLERLSEVDTMQLGDTAKTVTGRETRFWDCYFRNSETARIVLGDMGIEHPDIDEHNSADELQQTCLFVEFDEFLFPDFDLQPEGIALRVLDKLTGKADLDFDDSPKFSKKYILTGRPRDAVIELFSRPVRDLLESHTGFRVMAKQNRLLVFRPGVTCRPDETGAFLRDALSIVVALQSSGAEISVDTNPRPLTKTTARAEADQMGGLVGACLHRRLRKEAIEADEITVFLDQPVPRRIPRALHNQLKGDPFLVFFGSFFGAGGLIGLVTALAAPIDPGDRLLMGLLAGVFLLVGGTILFLVKFFERRRMQLLKRGRVATAILTGLSQTPFVNGNERVFEVKFRLLDDPDSQVRRTRIQGYPVNIARKRVKSGQPTVVLQDQDEPSRFLLIDCHAFGQVAFKTPIW